MVRSTYRRSTAIVACLMTEALDVCGSHMPVKVVFEDTVEVNSGGKLSFVVRVVTGN